MYVLKAFGNEMSLSITDIKKFYGCSIIMGCLNFPKMRMYWAKATRIELIANSMSRDRFIQLRSNIHFADTSEPSSINKFWRIQPVVNLVRERCNQLATEITSYSIDKQMVPFSGKRSKTQDQNLGADTCPDTGLGHGPSIILRLTKFMPKGSHIYFHRFFTTVPLIAKLYSMGFKRTGTIMSNSLGKNFNFPIDKNMKQGEISQFVKNDQVAAVKWCDTKCVIATSNKCGKNPIGEVKRWHNTVKRRLPIPIPYNANMGDVDICDQMIQYYRINMKTKKWSVKAYFHFFDLAILNSWMEYRNDATLLNMKRKDVKQFLGFKFEIGEVLCKFKDEPLEIVNEFALP
ncbi:piggyBac transposable element-derived protein 3-like [Condylostylus longicornis]|uniref:piggyBac transposable element-derived protein 3-like n=1 Tax=Condylostylus longicornis TaxID=2530218 RepID=UPI00244E57DC|nr:piggyBac transposable element-derived protein 3-like [Condylostylus longicornis]